MDKHFDRSITMHAPYTRLTGSKVDRGRRVWAASTEAISINQGDISLNITFFARCLHAEDRTNKGRYLDHLLPITFA